jgi:hypothetical protein
MMVMLQPCFIPDGCVTMGAKIRFLENKFVPGSDNVLSPYFKTVGHQFYSLADPAVINDDFKMYLLSRPKFAVPDVVGSPFSRTEFSLLDVSLRV